MLKLIKKWIALIKTAIHIRKQHARIKKLYEQIQKEELVNSSNLLDLLGNLKNDDS